MKHCKSLSAVLHRQGKLFWIQVSWIVSQSCHSRSFASAVDWIINNFSMFFYKQCLCFAGKSSIVIRFIKSFGAKVQNETSMSSSTSMGTSAVPPNFCFKLFSLKSWCMYCPSSQSHFFISFSQCSLFSVVKYSIIFIDSLWVPFY